MHMAASDPAASRARVGDDPSPSKSPVLRSVSINSSPTLRSSPKLRLPHRAGANGAQDPRPSGPPAKSPDRALICSSSSSAACRADSLHEAHAHAHGSFRAREGLEAEPFSLEEQDRQWEGGDATGDFLRDSADCERSSSVPGAMHLAHRPAKLLSPLAEHQQHQHQHEQGHEHECGVTGRDPPPGLLPALDMDLHPLELEDAESQRAVSGGEGKQRPHHCCRALVVGVLGGLVLCGLGAAAVLLGPLLFKNVILPLMEWQEEHLSKPLLALVGVSSMALLPVAMLPTGPSMWLLGIVFSYFWGFCFIMTGAFFGQTLPYAVGHRLMHDRVQRWLSSQPRLMAILRLADSGDWLQQFRTTLFLRMSPFPYPLFNYAITATNIKYGPYICASMIAMIPEAFIAIYCGKLIQKLALAHSSNPLRRRITPLEVAYEVLGLCVAGSVVLVGMLHGHRAFKELEEQERTQREGRELLEPNEFLEGGAGEAGSAPKEMHPFDGVVGSSGVDGVDGLNPLHSELESGVEGSRVEPPKGGLALLGKARAGYSRLGKAASLPHGDAPDVEGGTSVAVHPSGSDAVSRIQGAGSYIWRQVTGGGSGWNGGHGALKAEEHASILP